MRPTKEPCVICKKTETWFDAEFGVYVCSKKCDDLVTESFFKAYDERQQQDERIDTQRPEPMLVVQGASAG